MGKTVARSPMVGANGPGSIDLATDPGRQCSAMALPGPSRAVGAASYDRLRVRGPTSCGQPLCGHRRTSQDIQRDRVVRHDHGQSFQLGVHDGQGLLALGLHDVLDA